LDFEEDSWMTSRILLRSRLLLLIDLLLIVVSALGSFALRTDLGPLFIYYLPAAYWLIGVSIVIKPIVYHGFGLYRRLWVYASVRELLVIVLSVFTASTIVSLILTTLRAVQLLPNFPRSTLPIDFLLSLILVGGSRFSLRVLSDVQQTSSANRKGSRRALIVGAGEAGALVVRETQKNANLHLTPVCFLDDNPAKHKLQIHGVPVVGTLNDLARTVLTRRINEVIIAIPSAPGRVIRQVADVCRERGIPFRTMPGIYELIGGKVNVSRLREVEITDLLRREPTRINEERIDASLCGHRVLVTGAGGSIGRELCRQIARWQPGSLVLLGHGENSIVETLLEIQDSFPTLPLQPVIADVRDIDRLQDVFNELRPEVVFHTAAHKHVPLMEVNVEDAVSNNVLGTRNVVDVSLRNGVERLVMISTDKAIRPSSVYGATKRLSEMLVLDAARRSGLAYSVVRFGNVLGSRGSVVPLFKRQIASGGPVTITHPEMRRFFMTIPEAVHLVLQASSMGKGGEVFVLKMGEQVRIQDLAEDLIRLSGLEPGKDIEIIYTGIRQGEKLSEELWDKWAHYEPTSHPDILLLSDEDILTGPPLLQIVDDLTERAKQGDADAVVKILDECIPGADVHNLPLPDITTYI
jgi:FlaA1/EpsC-like NDP-sugar epimerase